MKPGAAPWWRGRVSAEVYICCHRGRQVPPLQALTTAVTHQPQHHQPQTTGHKVEIILQASRWGNRGPEERVTLLQSYTVRDMTFYLRSVWLQVPAFTPLLTLTGPPGSSSTLGDTDAQRSEVACRPSFSIPRAASFSRSPLPLPRHSSVGA